MTAKPKQEYTCPSCGLVWFGARNRGVAHCNPCNSKRQWKQKHNPNEQLWEEIQLLGKLNDRLLDETRMPWEKKYGKKAT